MSRTFFQSRNGQFSQRLTEDTVTSESLADAYWSLLAPAGPAGNPTQISLTTPGAAYTQNFDTLAQSSTSSTLPADWFLSESGTGANATYTGGTGSGNAGDTYSFGVAGTNAVTDRAFGGLQSGSVIPTIGASFTNNTGAVITSLAIAYTGEQWRIGNTAAARDDRLDFQISFNATSLTTGTWTDVNALDFVNLVKTAAAVGALDGNAGANRSAISATITSLDIADGATFWIRWTDFNATGSDDGLAIDDFSLTPTVATGNPGMLDIADASVTEGNSGTTPITFTVTRSGGTSGAVSATWTVFFTGNVGDASPSDLGGSLSGTVSFADGQTSETITLDVNGDTDVEPNETFTVTLSAPTGGASLGDATATGTINDDDAIGVSIGDVSITEGDSGTTLLNFTVTRTGGTGAFDVSYSTSDGTATDLADYLGASGTLNFLAGENEKMISIAIVGDTVFEPNETFDVTLSNATNGAIIDDGTGIGTILNDDSAPSALIVINEIDSDTPGTDAAEFVELYDGGVGNSALDGYVLVFFNGSNDTSYAAFDLDGFSTNANGFFTLGNSGVAGVDVLFNGNTLQNGADAVALYRGNAADFPNGTAVRSTDLVDAIVYGTSDADDTGLLTGLGETIQYDENGNAAGDSQSLSRVPDGSGGFVAQGPTPDAANAPPALTVAIAEAAISENGGTSSVTVTRSGALTGDLTVTLNSSDTGEATVPVSVTILNGEASATFTLNAVDDALADGSQFVTVTASAAGFADGTDTIEITDDEGGTNLTLIHDIQGTAFFSPILTAEGITNYNVASTAQVTIRGIVTAVDSFSGSGSPTGFYVVEELADWDGNNFTSEGIFVRTSSLAGITVGETVTVTASVMEFQNFSNLSRTFLVNPSSIVQGDDSNALPTRILDGTPGNAIPNRILSDDNPVFTDSNDSSGTFDPENDALDFWETVEGMRVTLTDMVVGDGFVEGANGTARFKAYSADNANAEQLNSRGGYSIFGDPQFYPVNTATTADDVIRGGRHLHDGDTNPDMIELDFGDAGIGGTTSYHNLLTMGDRLGDVTGIIDFDFTEVKLFVQEALSAQTIAGLSDTPGRETTTLDGSDARSLRVATFNVENFAPVGQPVDGAPTPQSKLDGIVADIKDRLLAPDIIILEEVLDNNGETASGGNDASTTLNQLVAALNAATGKTYSWVDQPGPDGGVGGIPGGNQRPAFLYDTARVQLGDLAANASLDDRRKFVDLIGDGARDANDLIAFDDSMLGGEINASDWSGTRRSIVGEFTFNGNSVYVFGSHLPSKGGSGAFYGNSQNIDSGQPANGDWASRVTLANDLWSMQNLISSASADNRVVHGGDFNEFWFYRAMETLTGYATGDLSAAGVARVGGTRYSNLMVDLLAEAERFSYDFDGRSQALDTIIADLQLAAAAQYDIVHINTGYNERTGAVNPATSDHDPSLARFDFRNFGELLNGTANADMIDGAGGDDTIFGLGGDDRLEGGLGDDLLNGGEGLDTALFSGVRATSTYSRAVDGTITVVGPDGTDTLEEMERLEFADGTIKFAFVDPAQWTSAVPIAGLGDWHVGDFDGDGKDDIFRLAGDRYGADTYLSTGTSFSAAGLWTPAGAGSDGRFYVGDFNGDGRDDMLRHLDGIGAQVLGSSGASFDLDGTWTPAGRGSDDLWHVGDFNGDGRDDLLRHLDGIGAQVLESSGASFVLDGTWSNADRGSDGRWYVGDFNGDGRDDLLRVIDGTGVQVLLSDGDQFGAASTWTPAGAGSDGTFEIGDFNGDGKADIARHLAGTGTQVFTSTGSGFASDGFWSSSAAGTGNSLSTGDFDGDGTSDLLRVLPGGTEVFI